MSLFVDITKHIGSFQLQITFDSAGGNLALLGDSGCGKSMTLRCIAGLMKPDRGRIVLNGRTLFDSEQHIDLPPQKRRIGYLLQQVTLFPNMTVRQNLTCAVRMLPASQRAASVDQALTDFDLLALADRQPFQLSGGQQQRAALARTMLTRPELLLLDEPFTALDDTVKWKMELLLLEKLQSYTGDVVFVSHSRDEVSRFCQNVCVVTAGRSEPVTGVETLMRDPVTVSAARISGCKNISAAEVRNEGLYCKDWDVVLHTACPIRNHVTHVGVRAHSFRLEGEDNRIPCVLDRVIDNVFTYIVMLQTPGGELLRMELSKSAWKPVPVGSRISVYVPAEDVMQLCAR